MRLTEPISIGLQPQSLCKVLNTLGRGQSHGQDDEIEFLLHDLPVLVDVGDGQVLGPGFLGNP